MIARVPVASQAAIGAEIDLVLGLERVKLFDPRSGESLVRADAI